MTVEVYKDALGEWRWRKLADNGNVIAESGEGYKNFDWCHRMASTEAGAADIVVIPSSDDPAAA